jgi:hypothetical protein
VWRVTAAVIVAHLPLGWSVRYEWHFAAATRNGYAGFVLFHGALAIILLSLVVAEREASRLVWTAFGVVTLGALGAVFRYDEVAIYRVPVIVLAGSGVAALGQSFWRRRAPPSPGRS